MIRLYMKESSLPVAPSPMPVKNRRTFHLICKCILYLVLNSERTKISDVWLKETKKGTASRLSPSILYFLILRAIDKHGRRLSICANVFIFFEVEKLICCFFQKKQRTGWRTLFGMKFRLLSKKKREQPPGCSLVPVII